MNRDTA